MLTNFLLNALGIIIFLFLFWRKLKEDYTENTIFTASIYILFALIIATLISHRFFPRWWFWASFLAVIMSLLVGIFRYRLRVFETVEAATISLLPWTGLIFLLDSIKTSSPPSFFGSLVILGLIMLFFVLDKHYKGFSWYKSGRVGFSGLTVLGLFFLVRAAIAIFFPNVLSFSGKYEPFLSGTMAFISFLLVFNLARRMT